MRWDEELAKEAAAQASAVRTAGNFFSVRGGQLSYQGKPIKGNAMDVIVIDFVLENGWYEDAEFDPDQPRSPACYAFGRSEKDMAPHAEATSPQNESCAQCPKNVFGSAPKGSGKACKNIRRLAVIPADALESGIEDAEVGLLRVPVTSCKAWNEYLIKLRDVAKRPTWAVITRVEVSPDKKTQVAVTFDLTSKIKDEHLMALCEKAKAVAKSIEAPYPKNAPLPAKPVRGTKAKDASVRGVKTTRKAKF